MRSGPLRSLVVVTLMLSTLLAGVLCSSVSGLELSYLYQVTYTSDTEYDLSAAVDSEGNYHLIYAINTDGDVDIIYAKVDPYGDMLAGPKEISPDDYYGNLGSMATDIDVDANDDVHIVFFGWTDDPDDNGNIYYAKMSVDGEAKLATRIVYDSEAVSEFPRVSADGYGNAYIVWNEWVMNPEIRWMKVSPSGNVVRGVQTVSGDLTGPSSTSYCDIAVTRSGVSHVVWRQWSSWTSQAFLYYSVLDSDGDVAVDPTRIVTAPGFDPGAPRCVVDSDDMTHLVYVRFNPITYEQHPRYALVSESGEVLEDTTITELPFDRDMTPRIAINEYDDVGIAYSQETVIGSGQYNAYLRVRWGSNGTWEPANQLTGSDDARATAITMNGTSAGVFLDSEGDIYLRRAQLRAINHPPYPYLYTDTISVPMGEEVTFYGNLSHDQDPYDTVEEYFFDFGDGSDSGWTTSMMVTHVYTETGMFYPWLSVKDNHGLVSEYVDLVYLWVTEPPPNEPPTAYVSTSPNPAEPGEEVVFTGSSSTDPDGTVEEYSFEFGDGTSTGWTAQANVSHSYSREGQYTASLTVRDDDGAESQPRSLVVTVRHVNEPPTATILSIAPNPAREGESITLMGTGDDPDGTVEAYTWESDLDGVLGSTGTVTVDNLRSGVHTISLQVRDDDGAWSPAATRTLEVKENRPFSLVDETRKREVRTDGEMHFKVLYTDLDNDPPTRMNLLYAKGDDWREVRLTEVDPEDQDLTDGKEYEVLKTFGPGTYKYSYEAENDMNPRLTTEVVEFQVLEEPVVPNPGAPTVMLAIISVALFLGVRRRGRG